MQRDLTSHRGQPNTRHLSRLCLFWLLAFGATVLVLSCGVSPATGEPPAPTMTASPSATHTVVPATDEQAAPTRTAAPSATHTPVPATEEPATPTVTASPSPTANPSPVAAETIPPAKGISDYSYQIVNVYPHDRGAFTQGLVYEDGVFYEGTGLRGESSLRRVRPETGEVLQLYSLPARYFGEGITIWGERIIQLTLNAGMGFVYDKNSFKLVGAFSYPTEGWGITHDETRLIMSDGTSVLYFWDPETYEEMGQIQVYDEFGPVIRLNELEYIRGRIYANVWQTDLVVIIDPQTGRVTGRIDLSGLLTPEDFAQPVDVLNGIAYDAERDRYFVTGKKWPKLFEIELVLITKRADRVLPSGCAAAVWP
jgi:glutamine cyclotransferase